MIILIVLGFNVMSTLVGHFVLSPREREKWDRRDSRDERDGTGRNENEWQWRNRRNKKHFPFTLTCCKDSRPCPTVSQYQLDTPVTQDTRHFCLTQPPPKKMAIEIISRKSCGRAGVLTLNLFICSQMHYWLWYGAQFQSHSAKSVWHPQVLQHTTQPPRCSSSILPCSTK